VSQIWDSAAWLIVRVVADTNFGNMSRRSDGSEAGWLRCHDTVVYRSIGQLHPVLSSESH